MKTLKELTRAANNFDGKYSSDEKNPSLMFGLTDNDILSGIVKGEIDPVVIAKYTLSVRGLDNDGNWIGFEASARLHFGE